MKTVHTWFSKTFRFSLLLINVLLGGAMTACNNDDPVPTPIRIAGPEDVSSYDALGGGKLCFQRDGNFLVIDADTKSSWGIKSVGSATMSPDGKYIAYVYGTAVLLSTVTDVVLYDIEHDKIHNSRDRHGGYNPSWTADSKNLLFEDAKGDKRKLIKQSIADDVESTVTTVTGLNYFSRISASVSDKLVFTYRKEEKTVNGIFTITMEGKQLTQLVADDPVHNWSPVWSPNGEQIAYIKAQLDTTNRYDHIDIMIMDKQGANTISIASVKSLATQVGFTPSLAWSPDGTRLAFNVPEPSGTHIYVVRPDGSGLTQLTSRAGSHDGHLSWSK